MTDAELRAVIAAASRVADRWNDYTFAEVKTQEGAAE